MMTIEQLEEYMAMLFMGQEELGVHYVFRQVEWAENEIQKKLTAQKNSLMPMPAHGGQGMVARAGGCR
ncbi:hypothetical protein [Noviherbaspirillum sedimenti]|uniref:Uncharacterized protein n=1 Tax=Noviherbaspirillum sedimenti TaxID=2320865 RepID=A0A3A3FXM2_9BURK|nr:hypothetical protein [Noviherbaspirillum sedimenti]RJG00958.1 hypothetical protein D3878_04620 [Noviherbaspirillum sedimenti]